MPFARNGEVDLYYEVQGEPEDPVLVLVPGDPQWPAALDHLHEPPYCQFVRGDPDLGALA